MLSCTIRNPNRKQSFKTSVFIDCGATGDFYDSDSASTRNLHTYKLPFPKHLYLADGTPSSSGSVTHATDLEVDIGGHRETRTFFLTDLGRYEILLGKPWLHTHNPYIHWVDDFVTFDKEFCRTNCLPTGSHQLCVYSCTPLPKPVYQGKFNSSPRKLGAAAFYLAAEHGSEIFAASLYEIDALLREHGDKETLENDTKQKQPPPPPPQPKPQDLSDVQSMFYKLHLENTNIVQNEVQAERHQIAANLHLAGFSLEDIQIALQTKEHPDPSKKLPDWLQPFLDNFDYQKADQLPPHRECDHSIDLKPGATPPWGGLYNMSVEELRVLRKWLNENLTKGFIRASTSQAAAPVLFAKKPGGGLRFCVDYRGLNTVTIKNRYAMPLIQETLSRLSKAKFFTKLDIIAAFNHIRIKEGQEWMTAFNTRYGLFETLVMPFGLSNAPATFQARINEILRPFLDIFCTAYIDDILIYSDTQSEHREHVKAVLYALRDAGLRCDIKKCEFEVQEVTYLGLIISTTGIKMDPQKVKAIVDWRPPSCLKDVQAFLGFSNFYRRFIKSFSRIVKPLVALTRKDVKFHFSPVCEAAFEALKKAFVTAPILTHFDPEKETFIEADSSDWVSAGILSQLDSDGELRPVAFMSEKFDSAQCNYEIYDKELLAIIRCFEKWRPELSGTAHPVTVLTDHRNLVYFMTTKQLSQRQVRWSEFLSQFNYEIRSRSGKANAKADALTRRSQDLPQSPEDERILHRNQALLKPRNLHATVQNELSQTELLTADSITLEDWFQQPQMINEVLLSPATLGDPVNEPFDHKFTRLLEKGYKIDPTWLAIKAKMTKEAGIPHSKIVSLSECAIKDDKLYFRDRLYIPETDCHLRTTLLQTIHDSVDAGHPGKNGLYELATRYYWWPNLSQDCKVFTANCHNCKRNNVSRSKYQGTLKPLPLPIQRWRDISIDFVGPLKEINGINCIAVVVCRLCKERHYIPCHTKMKATDFVTLFIREIWRLHGLPDSIVSDRGPIFVSELWRAVCHRLGVRLSLSTAYHPETDGQTENANAFMEQYLRKYINYAQDDVYNWLPMAEYAANNTMSTSTKASPFLASKGFHPRTTFGPPRTLERGASTHIMKANKEGNDFVGHMQDILQELRRNLTDARARQEVTANANRQPHPAYRVNDEVWLDTRNITTNRPIAKLDSKFVGPCTIVKVLDSHSYKLRLPFEHELMHDVFHPSLLRPNPANPLPGQVNTAPHPVTIDENGEKLWAIEAILDSRIMAKGPDKGFQYQVLWRGYDPEGKEWLPLRNVVNAKGSIEDFERRYPHRLKPTKAQITSAKRSLAATTKNLLQRDEVDSLSIQAITSRYDTFKPRLHNIGEGLGDKGGTLCEGTMG